MKPSHGGHRPGAGRKSGSGTFGEATRPLRVPQSRVAIVRAYLDACRRAQADVDLIGTDLFVAANASSIAKRGGYGVFPCLWSAVSLLDVPFFPMRISSVKWLSIVICFVRARIFCCAWKATACAMSAFSIAT